MLSIPAAGSQCPPSANNVAHPTNARPHPSSSRLDVAGIESRISFYFAHGFAGSSQKTYKSAEKRYLTFCSMHNISPLPLYESVLCKFVTQLAEESFQYRSIKTYLSGLRYFQISTGLGDPYKAHMPKLDYVLKGVKRVRAMSGSGARECLPITPTILRKLKSVWSVSVHDPDSKLLWAACCLLFRLPSGRRNNIR